DSYVASAERGRSCQKRLRSPINACCCPTVRLASVLPIRVRQTRHVSNRDHSRQTGPAEGRVSAPAAALRRRRRLHAPARGGERRLSRPPLGLLRAFGPWRIPAATPDACS